MTFVNRLLNASFQLTPGAGPTQFAESGTDTAMLEGLRMSAKVSSQGNPGLSELNLLVYGMTLSLMNQLSTLGKQYQIIRTAKVTVQAGDAQSGMFTVFQGDLINSWADFQPAPDVPFHVYAKGGYVGGLQTMPPTSFNGSTDVASFMGQCASKMNLTLENNGVNQKLSSPYFWGSPRAQAQQCAQAANINWVIDGDKLAIWPKLGSRSGDAIVVSPSTGMISYPTFTAAGILVRTLFNPQIKIGGNIQVQGSSLSRANGTWNVLAIDLDLESQVPKGQWFATLQCWNTSNSGQQGSAPLPSSG
jgi:hypothetical protein